MGRGGTEAGEVHRRGRSLPEALMMVLVLVLSLELLMQVEGLLAHHHTLPSATASVDLIGI